MTAREAKGLTIGQRVSCGWGQYVQVGTVSNVVPYCITIQWDDNITSSTHPDDMSTVFICNT